MIKNSYIKTKQYYKADKKVEKSVPKIAVSVHNNQDGTDGTNVASEYFYRYTILIIHIKHTEGTMGFKWFIYQVKSSNVPTTNFKL